ncbi:MAG: type VI secretion system baseplate subunit TssE, partial [Desulfovibrio sp.]|nr:type VI secretion system baseplate subunit TssE [Desulfovibrio sp.]
MDGTRLLERIRQMTMDQGQRKGKDRPSLEASVLEHLSKLLNTRQGSTIISSDYGVPDMSVMTAT